MDPQRRPAWSPFFNAECAVAAHSRPTLAFTKMVKAFAALCCIIGMFFLLGAWRVLTSSHEPEIDKRPVSWMDVFLEIFTEGGWIDLTVVDRFTAVVALVVFGFFFLWGGLYIGLEWWHDSALFTG